VALIPLSSQADAEKAIVRAQDSQQRHAEEVKAGLESDSDSDSQDDHDDVSLTEDNSVTSNPPAEQDQPPKADLHNRATSVAEDVISRKGLYGRFTQRWFSKGTWPVENKRKEGIGSGEDLNKAPVQEQLDAVNPAPAEDQDRVSKEDATTAATTSAVPNEAPEEVRHAVDESPEKPQIPLLPKLLNVSKVFFGSRSFFFSYDYDLSRGIANQPNTSSSVPLFRTFDPLVSSEIVQCLQAMTDWIYVVLLEPSPNRPLCGCRPACFLSPSHPRFCRAACFLCRHFFKYFIASDCRFRFTAPRRHRSTNPLVGRHIITGLCQCWGGCTR
jgi:hypothetical protein